MNLIVVVLDSLRQDHVSAYHGGRAAFPDVAPCSTPNLDAFARECLVFHNVYPEALPTIPIRYQLMAGQRSLPFRAWQPLLPGDITIADILRSAGYVCGLVSDTYHYWAPGMNYHRGFHSHRWVRGQEYDPLVSASPRRPLERYTNAHYTLEWKARVRQFLANTDSFTREEDWFPAQVVDAAVRWLKENRAYDKVFLWIDCFDPHEPWDPPARFDTYTDRSYGGPRLILPMGGLAADWVSAEGTRHLRGLYAGEVAFVDYWMGHFFTALKELDYIEDSLILVFSDHGHPLADHGKFLKGSDRLYNELLRVPFLLRLPGGRHAGGQVKALIQFHDVLPTLLDLLGLANDTDAMHGRTFRPVIEGDRNDHRHAVILGYHEGVDRCIRDDQWSLIERPAGQSDELYNLAEDPQERHNLIDRFPEEAARLRAQFGPYFRRRRQRGAGVQGKYELASGEVV